MSADEQTHTTTLTDFATSETEDTSEGHADAWQPEGGRECLSCGAPVTARYARVLGDNDGQVHQCPHCPSDESSVGERINGGAAGLDVDQRSSNGGTRT